MANLRQQVEDSLYPFLAKAYSLGKVKALEDAADELETLVPDGDHARFNTVEWLRVRARNVDEARQ